MGAYELIPIPSPEPIRDEDIPKHQVYRWRSDGYLQQLTTQRGERVQAESFEVIEWGVGSLFGDDEGGESAAFGWSRPRCGAQGSRAR